jgi:hypothetical protein
MYCDDLNVEDVVLLLEVINHIQMYRYTTSTYNKTACRCTLATYAL